MPGSQWRCGRIAQDRRDRNKLSFSASFACGFVWRSVKFDSICTKYWIFLMFLRHREKFIMSFNDLHMDGQLMRRIFAALCVVVLLIGAPALTSAQSLPSNVVGWSVVLRGNNPDTYIGSSPDDACRAAFESWVGTPTDSTLLPATPINSVWYGCNWTTWHDGMCVGNCPVALPPAAAFSCQPGYVPGGAFSLPQARPSSCYAAIIERSKRTTYPAAWPDQAASRWPSSGNVPSVPGIIHRSPFSALTAGLRLPMNKCNRSTGHPSTIGKSLRTFRKQAGGGVSTIKAPVAPVWSGSARSWRRSRS